MYIEVRRLKGERGPGGFVSSQPLSLGNEGGVVDTEGSEGGGGFNLFIHGICKQGVFGGRRDRATFIGRRSNQACLRGRGDGRGEEAIVGRGESISAWYE